MIGAKPALSTIAAFGLIAGLAACATSTTSAGSQPTAGASPTSSPTTAGSEPSSAPGVSPRASAAPATSAPVLITIKDFKYTVSGPVAPGAKVLVRNADSESHTITSSQGAFDVTVDPSGGTATFTAPKKAGTSMFECTFHADMTGKLVVK